MITKKKNYSYICLPVMKLQSIPKVHWPLPGMEAPFVFELY